VAQVLNASYAGATYLRPVLAGRHGSLSRYVGNPKLGWALKRLRGPARPRPSLALLPP
jgi:hypothetical protein